MGSSEKDCELSLDEQYPDLAEIAFFEGIDKMSNTSTLIQNIENQFMRQEPLPNFRAGDTIRVQVRIREGEKQRLQAFEGVCIARHSSNNRSSFTVRKISYTVGVERIFADNSPNVESVEVLAHGKVRQSRLFYLRSLTGKAARIKERAYDKANEEKKGRNKKRGAHRKATTTEVTAAKPELRGKARKKAKKKAKKTVVPAAAKSE